MGCSQIHTLGMEWTHTYTLRKEVFYLTTHSTHFIYGYMVSDIWLKTIQIVRKETRCRHIGYSFQLTPRDLLYAPSHRQDNTYHGLCYTSRGALAGTRNSSIGPLHEGSIRWPIAPWANALTTELHLAPPAWDFPKSYLLIRWLNDPVTASQTIPRARRDRFHCTEHILKQRERERCFI